jgi:hypothetical protein
VAIDTILEGGIYECNVQKDGDSYMNVRTGKKLRATTIEKKTCLQKEGHLRGVVRGGIQNHSRKESGTPGTMP